MKTYRLFARLDDFFSFFTKRGGCLPPLTYCRNFKWIYKSVEGYGIRVHATYLYKINTFSWRRIPADEECYADQSQIEYTKTKGIQDRVINDPFGQAHSPGQSWLLYALLDFGKWEGRTDTEPKYFDHYCRVDQRSGSISINSGRTTQMNAHTFAQI